MEHQNKKSMIPAFPATQLAQFTGLQNGGANALMSTLQSLQMHSLGTPMLPQPNLTTEFQQRMLLEQMKAMQSMYNNFGMKAGETSVSASNGGPSTSNTNYERNGTNNPKMASQNTIFPTSSSFLSSDLQNYTNSNFMDKEQPSTSAQHSANMVQKPPDINSHQMHNIDPNNSFGAFLNHQNVNGINLQTMNGLASSVLSDEWMKSIQPQRMDSFHPSAGVSTTQTQNVGFSSVIKPSSIPSNSEKLIDVDDTMMNMNKDDDDDSKDQRDDVEDIFGLANLDDTGENSASDSNLFGLPTSGIVNGGLSPVQFTPPDSPTETLTTDFLFGLEPEPVRTSSTPASCSSVPSTSTAPAALKNNGDITNDGFKVPEPRVIEPTVPALPPPPKVPIYARKFTKSNKVPVYKQKINTLTTEPSSAKKGENFDAFAFEDDDAEISLRPQDLKKEEDIIATCDSNSKNVYVPGIGFAISNDVPPKDLWKHVLPKKRTFPDNKQSQSSSSYPSSSQMEIDPPRQTDPAIVTLAESIRIRRNIRMSSEFAKFAMSNDTECAKTMRIPHPDRPPLPKYAIRISHIIDTTENGATKRKRKKKRNSDDDEDSDWDNQAVTKRKRKVAKKIYELVAVDPKKEPEYNPPDYHQKDVRKNGTSGISTRGNPKKEKAPIDTVDYRLSKFGSAEGFLPKGTYVVCKSDLLKEDCALWRVDNQNLLQKFPPRLDLTTKKQIYKSSSTYSGWCEQISGQYFRVSVKVLKQSRSETSIEPEIPLNELFPAMSEEIFKNPKTFQDQQPPTTHDETLLAKDPQRVAVYTLMLALLNHSLTMDYLQAMHEKSDWTYQRSLTEIDRANKEARASIRNSVRFAKKFDKLLAKYTRMNAVSTKYHNLTLCQLCNRRKSRKVLQLFDKSVYDDVTLEFNKDTPNGEETDEEMEELGFPSLPAVDLFACGRCAKGCEYLHKIQHMRLHLLRVCEQKLETVGTEFIEVAPERIVENVKKDKQWISEVVNSHIEMWKTIRTNYA